MRKRANPDSEPNIRRIDSKARAQKQTHGFQVHFLRGREVVTKMFSDTIYGGKESARRAARKFKNATTLALPERIFRGPSAKKAGGSAKKAKPAAKAKAKSATKGKAAAKSKAKAKAPAAAKSKKTTGKSAVGFSATGWLRDMQT